MSAYRRDFDETKYVLKPKKYNEIIIVDIYPKST